MRIWHDPSLGITREEMSDGVTVWKKYVPEREIHAVELGPAFHMVISAIHCVVMKGVPVNGRRWSSP